MKFHLFVTALFFPILFFSQDRFSIQLKTDDTPSVHGISYWRQLTVTGEDTSLVFIPDEIPEKKIGNLKSGKYTLTFSSVFGQHVIKKITLRNDTAVFFKLQKLNKKISSRVFSSGLKNGDTIIILHNATGRLVEDKVSITKKDGKLYAVKHAALTGNALQKREIFTQEIKYLQAFERSAAKNNRASGCSVIESYTIYLNKKYYTINDGTCNWAGYAALLKTLFPENE